VARDAIGTKLFFGVARYNVVQALKYIKALERQDLREVARFNEGKILSPMCVFDTQGVPMLEAAADMRVRLYSALQATVTGVGKPTFD